jgi:hypothetical protein
MAKDWWKRKVVDKSNNALYGVAYVLQGLFVTACILGSLFGLMYLSAKVAYQHVHGEGMKQGLTEGHQQGRQAFHMELVEEQKTLEAMLEDQHTPEQEREFDKWYKENVECSK